MADDKSFGLDYICGDAIRQAPELMVGGGSRIFITSWSALFEVS